LKQRDSRQYLPTAAQGLNKIALEKQSRWSEWSGLGAGSGEHGHCVQFYESDDFLLNSLNGFVTSGLGAGDTCVVVAQRAHRESLDERLRLSGVAVDEVRRAGRFVAIDSVETLGKLMIEGFPERTRFNEIIGGLISRAAKDSQRSVRVFGDMVAHLAASGKHIAAVELEAFWNELLKQHSFSLYCAYPLSTFGNETLTTALAGICNQHSHVIPAESFSIQSDPDAQLREIALLQQKARSLEVELKERERLLRREHEARQTAENANRLKDQFLATVSHELRTPLNAIIGWSHMLGGGKLDQTTAARAVQTILRNAKAQAQLIEDLLDISRMTTGNLHLVVKPVDLAFVINQAVAAVQLAAEAKGIQLEIVIDSSALRIEGDPGRLQQVVWNLLANAIKFTPEGGKVQVRLQRLPAALQIQVSDSGAGISPEFLPFIFDRFRQADGSTTRNHGGLGLGLAIVRHLVELHGGKVSAESEGEDRGATFTVTLPATLAQEGTTGNGRLTNISTEDLSLQAPPCLDHLRVLLVDDDRDTLQIVMAQLGESQADVRTATSVNEALEILEWYQPDVVVSDLAMPGEDGYSLIDKIRAWEVETGKHINTVALTAYVRVEDRARALSAGFNLFVAKPVQPNELVAAIANLTELQ
jgi:signal transduction histidine kinase